jgi:hypothetical protein
VPSAFIVGTNVFVADGTDGSKAIGRDSCVGFS